MDTSKRKESFLESFPPDIWAYFTFYLPGEQLARLMMTGATYLWRRLKSPNVVKSVTLGTDFMVFKMLPKFLNEFPSLEELSIHSCALGWSDGLDMRIDSIPSGVKKLEVSGKWWRRDANLFGGRPSGDRRLRQDKNLEGTETLILSKHLPHLDTLHLLDMKLSDSSWMIHSPQSLTKLSLRRWNGAVEFPSSLIHFEADTVDLSNLKFAVPKLPPSLASFSVTSKVRGAEKLFPILPPSLQKLSLGRWGAYSDGTKSSQIRLQEFPKSLTWLGLPCGTEINFEAAPESAALLPSTLTELNILTWVSHLAWPLFPRNLTKLAFTTKGSLCTVASKIVDENGKMLEVTSFPFDTLPRSITSLELTQPFYDQYFCGPPDGSISSFFPPQLTNLKIPMIQLSPETTKLLPPCLTFLEIGNFSEKVCEHLPRGLRSLVSSEALMSPTLIKFLPKSLTFLQLSSSTPLASGFSGWLDSHTGQKIDSIFKLPEYSSHERCLSSDFDWKDSSPLPSGLTYLNLRFPLDLGDSFLLHQHFPNLLELHLASKQISDLSIHHLPPHLTTLNLSASNKVTGESFRFLPRSLTHLNLDDSQSIFDSDIQHLPRTLKYAHLCSAFHLTDLCIPDLPPHLEYLGMSLNNRITRASLPNFPYSLSSTQNPGSVQFLRWNRL